jgi:eukaryotic-like serine/threonine-protein kinase
MPPNQPIATLDAFEVHLALGEGGSGRVFGGRHTRGVPVAIKVITSGMVAEATVRRLFEDELRAVAGLDHPNIAVVLEHGEVDPVSAAAMGVDAHAPYFVMERAASRIRCPAQSWTELRNILVSVLQALAHAHARGLVHRDVKPANILHFPDQGGRIKLCDFGVAAFEGAALERVRVGSPPYMSPEQLRGDWRDFGPWTDVHALACTAFQLASGTVPFSGDASAVLSAVAQRRFPPLHPRFPVPQAFEAWIHAAMESEPRRRVRRAADALAALLDLHMEVKPAPRGHQAEGPEDDATIELTGPVHAPLPVPDQLTLRRALPPAAFSTALPAPSQPPSPRLRDAGLALFGLRRPPMVGRLEQRDRLWRLLAQVARTKQPAAVLLTGPAGIGKSALARWACERAEEAGAAVSMVATHAERPGPRDGLAEMLRHGLRCDGLSREEGEARLRRTLAWGADAVSSLLWPRPRPLPDPFQTWVRALHAVASDRPLVIWADDVPHGSATLSLVNQLLAEAPELSLLVIGTARDGDRPTPSSTFERWSELKLGALTKTEWHALMGEMLFLDKELTQLVHERTAGVPLFALQLVGDWVDRGLLQVTDVGFTLAPGATVTLPEPLHALWERRMARVLRGEPTSARNALELAAVLGVTVDDDEWRRVLAAAGLPKPSLVVARMLRARLAEPTHGPGWRFVHGMFTESLLLGAQRAGRLDGHRQTCADVLQEDGKRSDELRNQRLATDRYRRALAIGMGVGFPGAQPFEDRAWLARMRCLLAESHERSGVLEPALEHFQAARALAESIHDEALLALAAAGEGSVRFHQGDIDAARTHFEAAVEMRRRLGDEHGTASMQTRLVNVHLATGHVDEAERLCQDILALAQRLELRRLEAIIHSLLGRAHDQRGDQAGALEQSQRALQLTREIGDPRKEAMLFTTIAAMQLKLGHLVEAERGMLVARGLHRDQGNRIYEAINEGNLGSLYQLLGTPEPARKHQLRSLELHRQTGHARGMAVSLLNLATMPGEEALAFARTEEALALAERLGSSLNRGIAHATMAYLHAGKGDWVAADASADLAEPLLRSVESPQELAALLATQVEIGRALGRNPAGLVEELRRVAGTLPLPPTSAQYQRILAALEVSLDNQQP